jgi:hypothetical protein
MRRTIPPATDKLLIRVLSRPRRVLGFFAAISILVSVALLFANAWIFGSVFLVFALFMGWLVRRANPRQTREYKAIIGDDAVIAWLLPWVSASQPLPADVRASIDWSVEFEFRDGTRSQPGVFRLRRTQETSFIEGLLQLSPPVEVRVVTQDGEVWVPQTERRAAIQGP